MLPWTLSTSQQPQQQMAGSPNINDIKLQDKVCLTSHDRCLLQFGSFLEHSIY